MVEKTFSESKIKNAYHRIYMIGISYEMLKDRPLLGWGAGGWQEAYQAYMDYRITSRQAHSYYSQLGVETAIPGLIIVAGLFCSFLYFGHRLFYASKDNLARRQMVWAITMAFLVIAGHSAIDFNLSLAAVTMVLWSLLGLVGGIVLIDSRGPTGGPGTKQGSGSGSRYVPLGAATGLVFILSLAVIFSMQSRSLAGQGIELLRHNQVERGVEYLERAVGYNPFRADYRMTLSQVYAAVGENDKAMKQAVRAVELSTHDIRTRDNLISVALTTGNNAEAAAAAATLIFLAPHERSNYENVAEIYGRLGLSELQAGNVETAREYFTECTLVPEKLLEHEESLSELSRQMWSGTKLEVTRKMHLHAGQAWYWLGDFTQARSSLRGAAKSDALKEEASLYLALLRDKQGREQDAQEYLAQAIEINPGIEEKFQELRQLPVLD